MKISTIKKIASLSILIFPLIAFQNCGSNVEFSNSKFSEGQDQNNEGLSIDIPIGLQALQSKVLDISPNLPKENKSKMNIVMVLDDSYSNLNNLENIMSGVEKLIDEIQEKNFEIKIFTTEKYPISRINKTGGRKWPASNIRIIDRIESNIHGTPLATLSSLEIDSQKTRSFLSTIRNHIDSTKTQGPQRNSIPDYRCGLLLNLRDFIQSPAAQTERFVFLVASDEDTAYSSNCDDIRKNQWKTVFETDAQTNHQIYVDFERDVEGGETETIQTYITIKKATGCDDANLRQKALETISSTSGLKERTTLRSDSLSKCRSRDVTPVVSNEHTSSSRTALFSNLENSSGFVPQLSEARKQLNLENVFTGLFIVKDNSDIKNSDQEVGKVHQMIAEKFTLEKNLKQYSINQSDYSDFIENVVEFEEITSSDKIDLTADSELSSQSQIVKLTVVEYDGIAMNEEVNFSFQNNELQVLDPRFNVNLGIKVKVDFY